MTIHKPSQTTQVIIVGAGLVGLTLALALAERKIRVTVIEAHEPELNWPEGSKHARVSALNLASKRIFLNLNIWSQLAPKDYGILRRLLVWDHLGGGEIHFDSTQAGIGECGYIVENRLLIRLLWQALQEQESVRLIVGHTPQALWRSQEKIQLSLNNEENIDAALLIGADGGKSWVREQIRVDADKQDYLQNAIIGYVHTQKPHQNTAWQNFLPTGPLALLPTANTHESALVWSISRLESNRILSLSGKSVDYEIMNAFGERLGAIETMGALKSVPLTMFHANPYVNERVALVGDAAHTIHPLAGQGANLGLLDVACLVDVIMNALKKEHDIGSLQTLNRYQRQRRTDNLTMQMAMTGFNQLFSNGFSWLVPLRSQGLNIANQSQWFKNGVLRYAAGQAYLNQFELTL